MATTIYSFVVRSGGDPTAATGLTPSFILYSDLESLADLSASAPTIVEVGQGHYKFTVDWDTAPESTGPSEHIVLVIDAGAILTDANERYITARINRKDAFADDIATLLDIETGKWEIVSDQLKVYGNDGVTLLQTFNLFDSNGVPTSVLPARREPV